VAPRIPPLVDSQLDDQHRELMPPPNGPTGLAANIYTTFVRHKGMFRRWMPFAGKLLTAGTLPARDRELLILRTGWNTASEYEWGQHVPIGAAAGVTDEDLERIMAGPDADGWAPFDATLIRAADELHVDACITDATWAALAERYNEQQLIELPFLVGHYHMVAFALNSVGVQREPGVPGLPKAVADA
jgi:alkylhydroperoxidase family enzyme